MSKQSPRIFEERKLVLQRDDGAIQIIFERAYDADVYNQLMGFCEWWGIATITLTNGTTLQKPFKILASTRAEAFANAEECWEECKEAAITEINSQLNAGRIVRAGEDQVRALTKGMLQ